jgi:cystathionine gamma-synthase
MQRLSTGLRRGLCSSRYDGTATAAVHADSLASHPPWTFSTEADVSPPISLSTTFTCPSADGEGHVYGRESNPTRARAETLLGAVEGTPDRPAHAVLYASGLAATFAALARLRPRRVLISGGYHGTHLVLDQLRRLSGGTAFAASPLPPPGRAAALLRPDDCIWIETPLNPTCELRDVAAYADAARSVGGAEPGRGNAHAHRRPSLVVDGTFAPPPLQRPLALGADLVMHSATKFLAGHSDACGGALCAADPTLAEALRADRTALGSAPGAMEAWLLVRSLRTLHLRVRRQSETASRLAAWLQRAAEGERGHPLTGAVAGVRHPSLPSDPCHALARRQMRGGFGGCLSLELADERMARALPGILRLFRDATSLGGVESLIEWRRKYDDAVSPRLLRVSVGLEDVEDLQADLAEAVGAVRGQAGR